MKVTLTISGTRLLMWSTGGTQPITFGDLQAGEPMMAQGRVADGVYYSSLLDQSPKRVGPKAQD